MFDQNEDMAGEKVDLATGKPFDNTTYTGFEDLRETNIIGTDDDDGFAELEESVAGNEMAKKWLQENKDKL